MSIKIEQNYQFWTDVLVQLRRIPAFREGSRLSFRDNATLSHAIIFNAMILHDCVPTSNRNSLSNWKRWCISTKHLDVSVLDHMLKDILLRLREVDVSVSYAAFKQLLTCDLTLIGDFLSPIMDHLLGFLANPNARDFRHLNQFLSFMTRVTLLDVNLEDDALISYLKTEERLGSIQLCPDLLSDLNLIIRDWMSGFVVRDIHPKHGPGGVAFLGRVSSYEKYKAMRFDVRLNYLIKNDNDPHRFIPHYESGETRTSEVVFVPKSMSSMRTISMEPSSLMYYQQGVWKQLSEYMASHPILSKIIRLRDQSWNRKWARIGSTNDSFATIDLSAASDSVSWEMVKSVFAGTDYYRVALLTRSTFAALPDGSIIRQKKFAPMGSTLCFPTQCIIFSAVCEYVARKNGVRNDMIYTVYGDDIIILKTLADELVEVLTSLGFLINTQKSYLSGRFKESCGGEYFDGVDVTPLKIPRGYKGTVITHRETSLYANVIDFANAAYARGLDTLRTFLIRRFWALPTTLYPLFTEDGEGLASSQPTNFHLSYKTDKRKQLVTVAHGRSKSPTISRTFDDEISYQMWFIAAVDRYISKYAFKVPEDVIVIRTATVTSSLRTVYSPDWKRSEEYAYLRVLEMISKRK